MNPTFDYDVFLTHSTKDKAVVRALAERLQADGVKVWFDEWVLKPGDSIPAKIEEGLERSRVLVLCMSVYAFGSDWARLESGTFRFRDPLNKERRFLPLRLDEAPIKGSLAQFIYINWLPAEREREYEKLLQGCRPSEKTSTGAVLHAQGAPRLETRENPENLIATEDYLRRRRDSIEKVFTAFEQIHAFFFKICLEYMTFVEILHAGLKATESDRTKYYSYTEEIGRKLQEMHLLEGRLSFAGAEQAVHLMQQYRLQAVEVNNLIHLQLPALQKEQVSAVAKVLFIRKENFYKELAKALKEGGIEGGAGQPRPRNAARGLPIGDAWSGIRGVLEGFSTSKIKGILGKAGLPIERIDYRGTYKGPVLDEADKLVSSMLGIDRDRFATGCIHEIIALEHEKATNLAKTGGEPDGQVVQNLRRILARFGHDLTAFEEQSK